MTIKDLYEWAKENGVENLPFIKQWEDGGGSYTGGCFVERYSVSFACEVTADKDNEELLNYISYCNKDNDPKKFVVI